MENGKFLLIGSGERKNEFFKLCFPGFQVFIMSFDHLKFTGLFRGDIAVNGVTEFREFLFAIYRRAAVECQIEVFRADCLGAGVQAYHLEFPRSRGR